MTQPITPAASIRSAPPAFGFRVWHLWLLSVLVAVAIVNIQDQHHNEPALIGLAVAGFVLYGLLGWGGWRLARSFRSRLGAVPLLAVYLAAMAALFLVATIVYLVIEHAYLFGV
jgi:hypothetical protein